MSDDKGQVLLSRLVKISTALSGRSREVLEPFKGEIRTLSKIFGGLDAKLNSETTDCTLLEGAPPAVQKIKKNTKAFYDELGISRAQESKVATGLRLGMKLNVVERIGRQYGFSAFLSLLLVFELARTYRIRYDSFLNLIPWLRDGIDTFASMKSVAEEYGSWWEACQSRYSAKFAKFDNHQCIPEDASVNAMHGGFDEGLGFTEPGPLGAAEGLSLSQVSDCLFDGTSWTGPSPELGFVWSQEM
ncbi:hypothetical protein PRZ48_010111 [Zasmidium cellare]|uniref:Uncharacterized protein n=1 Tax=Zasmidium cellare TaxID=395010 RepID=A0ABR0EEG2_ZASCE|nr:hypothetical protein PRZ48_010111 [Zasmidium cellare]